MTDNLFYLQIFVQYASGFVGLVHCRKMEVQEKSGIFQKEQTGPLVFSHKLWNISEAVVDS